MGKLRILALLFLLSQCRSGFAQSDFSANTWNFIDSSIGEKNNLGDMMGQVNSLLSTAIAGKEYFHAGHCYDLKIKIADQRTEDSLYFKNSAFIDTLLTSPGLAPSLQLCLEVMLAKRLNNFRIRGNRFQRQTYQRNDILINYAAYNNDQLDSITRIHFATAKELAKTINRTVIDDALWISSDPLQFLFRPALFDLVIGEQISTIRSDSRTGLFGIVDNNTWLSLSQSAFAAKLDEAKDSKEYSFSGFSLYAEWMHYHQDDRETWTFIESLARKYCFNIVRNDNDEVIQSAYEKYLQSITVSPYNATRAHGIYQLCLLWNSEAGKYFPGSENDYLSISYHDNKDFDERYRYHAVKALQLFDANRQLMDSFYYLEKILIRMEDQVKSRYIKLKMEGNDLPGEPMLAELKFKNTDSLYYRIIRINMPDLDARMQLMEATDAETAAMLNNRIKSGKKTVGFAHLLSQPIFLEKTIILPATNDYNYHASYLKLDPLPAGSYVILFSSRPVTDTLFTADPVYFKVTDIAIANNDRRVYVLHRKTGMPLEGASVTASWIKKEKGDSHYHALTKKYTVNKEGYIIVDNKEYDNLEIRYHGDTAYENVRYKEDERVDDIYNKDDFDDLADFYDENASAYIFTDRAIYRPGQTVFYKALFVTKDPKTGKTIVMNKQNLKGKLFNNVYKKWLKEDEPMLTIRDPFNKKMDSLKILPNEFGSVSGSFKIPKTAATGEWDIDPEYIDVNGDGGHFSVEEYKRPTYEVTIEKPKQELLPGDEFTFTVKVRSFAGASLNNVKVDYSVSRSGAMPGPLNINDYEEHDLLDTSGYTDNEGMLKIVVKDSLLKTMDFGKEKKWNFRYNLEAETTDETGESYDAEASVDISTQPLSIRLPLLAAYERNHLRAILVTMEDNNAGQVSKPVIITIYKKEKNEKLLSDRKLGKVDMWLYDQQTLQQAFPYLPVLPVDENERKQLVFTDTINSDSKKLELKPEWLTAGNYELVAQSRENGILRGEIKRTFSVFDEKEKKLPQPTWSFSHFMYNSFNPGDTASYYYGNSEKPVYTIFHIAWYTNKNNQELKSLYEEKQTGAGLQYYRLKVPAHAIDHLRFTQICILNNQLFTHTEDVYVNGKQVNEPEIIIEKYRKKLAPGSQETFSVSVKTKNENVAAELMTTMYDASLDKLEEHHWDRPATKSRYRYIGVAWQKSLNAIQQGYNVHRMLNREERIYNYSDAKELPPDLWWTGSWGSSESVFANKNDRFETLSGYDAYADELFQYTDLRLRNISITSDALGLNEVVVTGYGSTIRRELTGAVSGLMVRGINSLSSYDKVFVVLDGVPYEGDINKIDVNTITEGLVLKGADAEAIYGSRAAKGVLVLSTKGKIVLPKEPEPVIIPRKNFSESAFFFPAIHADRNGIYSFSFTMPESVTEWNWKLLAHTKNALAAYTERKLTTQLPLMVQPNMPRLLYQGDKIILQNRISNLDTSNATGKIVCTIEDEVTGEDITQKLLTAAQHDFSIPQKSNIASSFEIKIPVGQLNPLKIKVTVRSQNFADGEEHIIPVLSPEMFVRDNRSFAIMNAADSSIQLPGLADGDKLYGIGLSIVPKPQAALINSLPYLANYPFGCAEQTFNKLLANITALHLMRTDSSMQHSFNIAKESPAKENAEADKLPAELAKETMPWLNLADQTVLQQQQLADLMDTARASAAIDDLSKKLFKLQTRTGGLSWFSGGESNFYISCYVLRGFGVLKKDQQLIPANSFTEAYHTFINALIGYCDQQYAQMTGNTEEYGAGYYLYARSNWLNEYPLSDSLVSKIHRVLLAGWKDTGHTSLYNQALLAISSIRYSAKGDELYTLAVNHLRSIRQLAIEDEAYGMRWKDIADADDLTISTEETVALLAEALEATGMEENAGISKWLLTAKSDHHWISTKATSAAIGLLGKLNKNSSGPVQALSMQTSSNPIKVSDDLFNATSFEFIKTTTVPSAIQLHKENKQPARGSLSLYYFSASDKLSSVNKDVQLTKEFYKWNEGQNRWEPFSANEVLKIADKIKVTISVISSRPLRYVYIDDKRAAAFEPTDIESGYEYGENFRYYKSVRDAGFQFFAEFIPSGKHEFEYELKVAQEGNFISGPASLQCMYRPDVSAYSNSMRVVTQQ